SYISQNSWPPFAEFVGVHQMILSGGDAWANLVQWFALAMIMVAASLLARDLVLALSVQLLAALLVLGNANIFLQSLNTTRALAVGLWLCRAAWWAVRRWHGRPWALAHAVLFGTSVGLLALNKGTGYVYAIPVILVGGLGVALRQWALLLRSG